MGGWKARKQRGADRRAGGRRNYSQDMEGGREDSRGNFEKKKVHEKAMKKWRHGERANEAY